MITFPFAAILVPYALVLLFAAVMAVINVTHLIHYGATTRVSFLITFIFLAGAALIVFTTWKMTEETNWMQPVSFNVPAAPWQGAPPSGL